MEQMEMEKLYLSKQIVAMKVDFKREFTQMKKGYTKTKIILMKVLLKMEERVGRVL
jgi:hypothetical protein